MGNKLMTPTEKEVDFFSVYSKECNGCKRHGKDMMLSYTIKEDKTLLRTLTPKMEVYEKFKNLGIDKKVFAHHQHNEHKALAEIIRFLKQGQQIALISDAGTPAISDPGFLLVREVLKNQIAVECLPGATAFVPALVNSGISTDRFTFEGFLPVKKGRQTRLKELAEEKRTMIFYESPHRLLKSLEQFAEYYDLAYLLNDIYADRLITLKKINIKLYEQLAEI